MRKPREPSEKERMGGTIRWKSQEVNRTVPSPPRVSTRSNFSGDCQQRSEVQYLSMRPYRAFDAIRDGALKRFEVRSLAST